MVEDQVSNLREGFLLEGRFLDGSLDCTLRNHLLGARTRRSGRHTLLELFGVGPGGVTDNGGGGSIVRLLNSLLESMVEGAWCSPESRCLCGPGERV